jgi:UDP-N-acetylmuramoyl-L-alanyl-D-glutamate--2,6-diaminopimelate ligase
MQSHFLDEDVTGLFFDSSLIIKNSVFFAITGSSKDGHQFIADAIKNGAVAIILEDESNVPDDYDGIVFKVNNVRKVLDETASSFYNFPSNKLFCVGVTGTNGKTSITYILEHILNFNKKLTGVMGTVNHHIGDLVWSSQMTTPDPVTLQSRLNDFVQNKAFAAVMEVSSHALDQNRADSVNFNSVIFTNLTLDHLDYHKTMNDYFESKQKLFTDLLWKSNKSPLFAIVNTDDKYGRKLRVPESTIVWTYGQNESDFQIKIKSMSFSETVFDLITPIETKEFRILVPAVHTVYNVVACILAAITCGVTLDQAAQALLSFYGIPGRLEKVESNSKKIVFVDYAHTPDALENTLTSIRKIQTENKSTGKVICLIGCGGDRDRTKRPLMAKVATMHSDYVIVTSDNPRTENPEQIINDILAGIPNNFKNFKSEINRESAIEIAINQACDEIAFSDFKIAQKFLK